MQCVQISSGRLGQQILNPFGLAGLELERPAKTDML